MITVGCVHVPRLRLPLENDVIVLTLNLRARIHDVAGRAEDAGRQVLARAARRGNADQFAALHDTVPVRIRPARAARRRVAQVVRQVVAPRQRRLREQARQRVRERDLRVVV
jgi:hypothetical protein